MNLSDMISIVNNVGFPIASYAALFYVMFRQMKTMNETLNELRTLITEIRQKLEK